MKELFKNMFSIWFELPYKEIGNILFWSLRLYSLALIPYIAGIITGLMFMLLTGTGNLYGLLDFTRAYFYDGYFLFTTWRIHLVFFIFCVVVCINEELK